MASEEQMAAIKSARVLMIGAGGIGCELLKTLVMTGFETIHIIDLDTIDVSNLNRQLLFRKAHVGQSKAKVAREAALRLRPLISITAHHANVMDPHFDVDFFSSFAVVLNGLDNVQARRHVNRLCLAAQVPLVESGTTGYLGQVSVHVAGVSKCYECDPKPTQKSFPTCTITNTPSKPIHCIVWAKELPFVKLFGDPMEALDMEPATKTANQSEPSADVPLADVDTEFYRPREGEAVAAFARRIFDRVFGTNVEKALEMEDMWKSRAKPRPLFVDAVLAAEGREGEGGGGRGGEEAGSSSSGSGEGGKGVSAMRELNLRDTQAVWTVAENAKVFLKAIELFFTIRSKEIGSLSFSKDDDLAVQFVAAASNLRSHSFGIEQKSVFEVKGIAGSIVHAIATTNAIIAGAIVLQATAVLLNKLGDARTVWCSEYPNSSGCYLLAEELEPPNPHCYVCSKHPLELEIDCERSSLGDVVRSVCREGLGATAPIVSHGSFLLFEEGDDLEDDERRSFEANLNKVLSKFVPPIANGSELTVEDYHQAFKCSINIKQRAVFDETQHPDRMVLHGKLPVGQEGEAAEAAREGEIDRSRGEGGEDGDGDFEIIEEPSERSKRKLDDVNDDPPRAKKMKVDDVIDLDD